MISIDVALDRGDFALDVAFDSAAKVTALFGPSGAGKSTLIDLIAGLERPDRGRIVAGGAALVDTEAGVFVSTRRRRVGLVFQDALLFPHFTVAQNLRFGGWFAPRGAARLPLERIVDTLGIGALMDRRPQNLSGGERQRVGLARALMAAPRLLLMDEPFAALDNARRHKAMALVELARDAFDIPIVLVSHRIDEVMRLAEKVAVIERGRLGDFGSPEEIFAGVLADNPSERFGLGATLTCAPGTHDAAYGLTRLAHPAGALFLSGRAEGEKIRVFVKATDVSLALSPPSDVSIRTVLSGRIARVAEGAGPLALATVELDGGERIFASLTRFSAHELGLAPEKKIFALVKTVALDEREVEGG